MTQMMETFIKHMINRLNAAGIDDPTHEVISCKFGATNLKFRLYSQEQWDSMIGTKNEANKIAYSLGLGKQPDSVITHKDKVFLVEIIK